MAFFKWFEDIESFQAQDRLRPKGPLEPFLFESLKPATTGQKLMSIVIGFGFKRILPPVLRLCQKIAPIPYCRCLNLAIVTRDADVRQVLSQGSVFGVPYGPEMTELGDGYTFGLGLDGPDHLAQNQLMRDVMHGPDGEYLKRDLNLVLDLSRRTARNLIETSNGRIDVFTDYFIRVVAETGAQHLGIEVSDPKAFAEWSMAVSTQLFGDPLGDEQSRALALNGGKRLRLLIAESLFRAKGNKKDMDKTVLDRLVYLQRHPQIGEQPITDGQIVAILLGLITGFIPTNTLTSSKMLSELLKRPGWLAKAKALAIDGDREGLKAILKEAARMDSPLAPGQWRIAKEGAVIGAGTSRKRQLPVGTVVLVSTMTALRDPRRFVQPNRFRVDRDVWGDLMFGGGPHACLGASMAIEQLTELFMILLAQPGLKPAPGPAGKIEYTGPFPVRLDMTFDMPSATQSMFLIVAPVKPGISKYALDKELEKLGHGANISAAAKAAFDGTGIVHFASMSSVLSDHRLDIILELSVDGDMDTAINTIASWAADVLRPILALSDLDDGENIADCMRRHVVTLHTRPWGATGLDYFGTNDFSVPAIEKQEEFAKLVESILACHLNDKQYQGNQPMTAVTYVRRVLGQDRFRALQETDESTAYMIEAAEKGYDTYAVKPSRAKLKLADFSNTSYWGAVRGWLGSSESRIVVWPILAMFLLFTIGLYQIVAPPQLLHFEPFHSLDVWGWLNRPINVHSDHIVRAAWGWTAIISGAFLATALLLANFVATMALWLRVKEKADKPDPAQASPERIEELCRNEDFPGYAHNHFMALGDFKPGLFRNLIHTFALWGIRMIIIFYYRPGFVTNMGTIHYARWWRLPGTNKSIFFANYDGSWESYLEDFITRARWGQTAAWSNWQGFPKTKFLIYEGAQDGDRFKRWVRTKQQIVPFWYSRFPHLTTDQIRNNALIHHGLARVQTDSEAREWLRSFGSMPRVDNLIETDEVQSLVFRGMRGYDYSACLIIKLPEVRGRQLYKWLSSLNISYGDQQVMGEEIDLVADPGSGTQKGLKSQMMKENLPESSVYEADANANQPKKARRVLFLAFSAAGLEKIRGNDEAGGDLPDSFPPVFRIGMAKRSRILGDFGDGAPTNWRWTDEPEVAEKTAEAALMIYATSKDALDAEIASAEKNIVAKEGKVWATSKCAPAWADNPKMAGREHFGYRDGISQPVIRGTERYARSVPNRDIVEPGEFILGYQSNQGYFPPSPLVRAEADPDNRLPVPTKKELSRFPDFGAARSGDEPHDFGRNGSFIVIRELQQHVDRFEEFIETKASELDATSKKKPSKGQVQYLNLAKLVRQDFGTVTTDQVSEWLKAKLMGRWPDGRPLISNASSFNEDFHTRSFADIPESIRTASKHRAEHDNDFSYGIDDPQGMACPFGAHIRRTNPRDSKQPGDVDEQTISNRHRLLRRGRSYTRDEGGAQEEKGMLFVALCTDLERQFEFVQQTWANSPSFHGLTDEPDPIIGSGKGVKGDAACFTIPTPSGPVKLSGMKSFVTTKAGGYFFLPSRSAIAYLKGRADRLAAQEKPLGN